MSTRYVWEQHYVNDIYTSKTSSIASYTYTLDEIHQDIVASQGNYYKIEDNGKEPVFKVFSKSDLSISGYWITVSGNYLLTGISGRYTIPTEGKYGTEYPEMIGIPESITDADLPYYSLIFNRTGNTIKITLETSESGKKTNFLLYKPVFDHQEMGTFFKNATASSRSAYPDNGIYGDGSASWFLYKGSDNIDPLKIQYSYSKAEIETGDAVTVSVSPRQPTYGGTIYYQYQYSTNGGTTWYNAGSKTTATSKIITVPEGAEHFKARVYASDGWGFTSTTYVSGENLPVSQIKAYATVSGKLRAGAKMYAAVGGKIRQVQKGYATVGGKIRKLF